MGDLFVALLEFIVELFSSMIYFGGEKDKKTGCLGLVVIILLIFVVAIIYNYA